MLDDPRLLHIKAPDDGACATYFWDTEGNLLWFNLYSIWRFDKSLKRTSDIIRSSQRVDCCDYISGRGWTWGTFFPSNPGALEVMAELSPDGRRMLWIERASHGYQEVMLDLKSNAGANWVIPVSSSGTPAVFASDSRHWVGWNYNLRTKTESLLIGDAQRPGYIERRPLNTARELQYMPYRVGPDLIALYGNDDPPSSAHEIIIFSVKSGFKEVGRNRFHTPGDVRPELMDISSSSARLAWLITCPPTDTRWNRVSSRLLRASATGRQELWVSHIDGTHWRKIGLLEGNSDTRCIRRAQWLPDGKRLSVLIGDTIWIVPVD